MKYTLEKVKEIFFENNCVLLESNYINNKSKMKFKCSCRNISSIRLSDFLYGQRCQKCKGEKLSKHFSFDYEYVYEYFSKHNCILISDKYINSSQKLDYICECGELNKISFIKFKSGQRCDKCRVKKLSKSNRLDYTFVKMCFEERGCKLLSKEYNTSKEKLDYICHCGNISQITFSNFYYKNQDCEKCRISKCSGENHPRWNSNLTQEDRLINRNYPEYTQWVKSVYKRDDFTCQCCGKHGGDLNAHHIFNYAEYPDLRIIINNGVTLCKHCHVEFHKLYGYINNNKKQIDEFIHSYILFPNVH